MIRPETNYARTADGLAIAYLAMGDGPLTTVLVPGLMSEVELLWEEPSFEQFVGRIASFTRLIMYDRRGSGLSDRVAAPENHLTLSMLANDVEAVLAATQTDRAVLIGASLGAMTALQYAAESPARIEAVILIGAWAGVTRSPDRPFGVEPEAVDEWVEAITQSWGSGWSVDADCPSMRSDERYRAWAARLERHTYSPSGIAQVLRVAATYDVRPLLSSISAPTLVLHRVGDRMASVEQARFIAARIPDSTYVELSGDEHMYFLGDQQVMLDAILRFLDRRVTGGALRRAARKAERNGAYALGWQSLSRAELDVAILAAVGMTNKDIARRLRKSPHTVDGHLRRVFAKLDVASRVGVANAYARVDQSDHRDLAAHASDRRPEVRLAGGDEPRIRLAGS